MDREITVLFLAALTVDLFVFKKVIHKFLTFYPKILHVFPFSNDFMPFLIFHQLSVAFQGHSEPRVCANKVLLESLQDHLCNGTKVASIRCPN